MKNIHEIKGESHRVARPIWPALTQLIRIHRLGPDRRGANERAVTSNPPSRHLPPPTHPSCILQLKNDVVVEVSHGALDRQCVAHPGPGVPLPRLQGPSLREDMASYRDAEKEGGKKN